MIIVLKNADFSQSNIGTLSSWRISRSLGAGATYEGPVSVDKGAALSATVTLAENYEIGAAGVVITMGGVALSGAHSISGNVITITIASVTGNVLIKVPTINTATGEEEEPDVPDVPDTPTNGQWLSVLLTGDENAHDKFMNGNVSGASPLTTGYDIIYAESQAQAFLEGKKIYKFASNGLGNNTITLYSNPWQGDNGNNTTDNRTVVGTVTSTSDQAVGTIIEYPVDNPLAIRDNETLSVSWTGTASGIKTVEGYNTIVYHLNPKDSTTFKTKLTPFCSFDFFIGG